MWQTRSRTAAPQYRVMPSLLDRLLPLRTFNEDECTSSSPVLNDGTLAWSVEAERRAVRQDLEDLLNTAVAPQLADTLPQALRGSILNYGLPELGALSANEEAEHEALCQSIKAAIVTFEPRLSVQEVSMVASNRNRWLLQVQIAADLLLEPTAQRIVFDATLPLMTRHFEVKETAVHAR